MIYVVCVKNIIHISMRKAEASCFKKVARLMGRYVKIKVKVLKLNEDENEWEEMNNLGE